MTPDFEITAENKQMILATMSVEGVSYYLRNFIEV